MAHGVTVSEVPTGVKPPVRTTAGLPVYVGTAPINLGEDSDGVEDLTAVNVPVICYTLAEAVAKFGEISDVSRWGDWTIHEAMKAHFSVFSVAPVVFINVIDPDNAAHVNTDTGQTHLLDADGEVILQTYGDPDEGVYGVIKSTVVIKKGPTTMALGTDYTLAFDADGFLVVTAVAGGQLSAGTTITASFDYLDPSGVTEDDIIGGYTGGAYTGLEVIEQVYPKLRLVPGIILSPKWSQQPDVAARMATIAGSINGAFRAHAFADLSTDPYEIPTSADAPAWKSDNGFNVDDLTPFWPKFKNGDDVYHLSTIAACRANLTDSDNGGIPFESPSNKAITGTAAVDDYGDEILLTPPQANALNAQGIVTALNGFNGWRLWGNRTGVYPGNTDPKDAFIPIRRMFNYIKNTTILTVDRDVDRPGNRRLIDGVVGTMQSFLNSLIAVGALVAGTIEFREDENNTTDMADGIYRFHYTLTPPSPAEQLDFVAEYDPTALAALFA
jgi:uncharacterized protein